MQLFLPFLFCLSVRDIGIFDSSMKVCVDRDKQLCMYRVGIIVVVLKLMVYICLE